jgi:hypothetical protein
VHERDGASATRGRIPSSPPSFFEYDILDLMDQAVQQFSPKPSSFLRFAPMLSVLLLLVSICLLVSVVINQPNGSIPLMAALIVLIANIFISSVATRTKKNLGDIIRILSITLLGFALLGSFLGGIVFQLNKGSW